jgi:hypothetical protein
MKINKRDAERIHSIINSFYGTELYNRPIVEGTEVKIPKNYRRYIQYMLLEKSDSAVINSISVEGTIYKVEQLDSVFYFTRNVDGNEKRALLTKEENDEFGPFSTMNEKKFKELIYYIEHVRGALGL